MKFQGLCHVVARDGLHARSLYLDELAALLLTIAVELNYLGQR